LTEASLFLLKAILDIVSVAVFITFFFRLLKVDYYNPIVQGILKIADIVTSRLRVLVKPVLGIDLASLIIVILFQALSFYVISISGNVTFSLVTMFSWSLFSVMLLGLRIAWWALILGIITSWVAPRNSHPAIRLLQQMSDQICKPFRVFLPPMGGLDFSPILAFLILQFLYIAVINLSYETGLPMNFSIGL
jgi:YggT family protein